jgi:hypothetical protein
MAGQTIDWIQIENDYEDIYPKIAFVPAFFIADRCQPGTNGRANAA